ncbi:MAG: serine hydrolase [Mariprofundus sp.]
MRLPALLLAALLMPLLVEPASAFPLDAAAETGIQRLEGYRLAQQGKVAGNKLPSGALLGSDQIHLQLIDQPGFVLPSPDRAFTAQVVKLLGRERDAYSISVLDLTDPAHIRLAEHHANVTRNPASVGKIMVALALFQALADIYPDDLQAREKVLHDSIIVADRFIRKDHHKVPFWLPEQHRLLKRKLVEGDSGNMWSWLDHMLSPSSNAAASMVIKHLLLLRHYGRSYPVSEKQADAYFGERSRAQLHQDLLKALLGPLAVNGIDSDRCRQGSFFTREGKRRVPGTNSICTTRALMHYLVAMEQGKLVDSWSSLQLKRLLYLTGRRIRYASAPALANAAIYFKSGSFYRCQPEAGFVCKKYQGNRLNVMNSVAIVAWPSAAPKLRYIVTLTSNVLRKNSAISHQTLATRLHALLRSAHAVQP